MEIKENKRDFKGIWIPKEIWLNKDLTVMEKLFLVEIDSLDNENGCFASNAYFSEFFGVSKGRCTQILKDLETKNYITIEVFRDGKVITKRVVRILNTLFRKLNTPSEKTKYPYLENAEDNNTSINNTIEREKRALDFLQKNKPIKFEQQFLMHYKSKIKDFQKFCSDFNNTCDIEELPYKENVLFARLFKYADNWMHNQAKYDLKVIKNDDQIGLQRPDLKRIG